MSRKFSPNEYKYLSAQVGRMARMPKGTKLDDGWVLVQPKYDQRSNFKGALFEKDGQYALAFAGTDAKNVKDWGANLKMILTGSNKQTDIAKEFADEMINKYNLNSENTVSTGTSEGGHEATHVGIEKGLPTYTFNAFGVRKKEQEGKNYNVVNYRDPHDPVSKLKRNVGETYIVPSTQGWFKGKTPFGSINAHRIQNMGDIEQAIPVEEYKKRHPMFLDGISDAEITREDIAMMEPELFSVYEKEIDERLKNNQIRSNAEIEELLRKMGLISQRNGYYRRLSYV